MAYLSTIIDGEKDEGLTRHVSNTLQIETVLTTLKKLCSNPKFKLDKRVIFHSDQGCQHISLVYQELLKKNHLGIRPFMLGKGIFWGIYSENHS